MLCLLNGRARLFIVAITTIKCYAMTRLYDSQKVNGYFRFSCKVYDGKSFCAEFHYYVNNGQPDITSYNRNLLVPAFSYELRLFISRAMMAASSSEVERLVDNLNDNDSSLVF